MRKFLAILWLICAPVGAQEVTRYLPPGADAHRLPVSLAIISSEGIRQTITSLGDRIGLPQMAIHMASIPLLNRIIKSMGDPVG